MIRGGAFIVVTKGFFETRSTLSYIEKIVCERRGFITAYFYTIKAITVIIEPTRAYYVNSGCGILLV